MRYYVDYLHETTNGAYLPAYVLPADFPHREWAKYAARSSHVYFDEEVQAAIYIQFRRASDERNGRVCDYRIRPEVDL